MRDYLLFAVLPYLGGLVFVGGSVLSIARGRFDRRAAPTTRRGRFDVAWRAAFAAIAIAHVFTLMFPGAALRWDREFSRLMLFEGTRLAAGALAAAGAVAVLARRLHPGHESPRRVADVVAATLLVTAAASGLGVAILYRWASAWSAVTLAPYLTSLARLDPSTELVTGLPVLVKLHVVSAIAVFMVFPFTSPARAIGSRMRLQELDAKS